ncbi:MAG: hypothetical protein ACK4PR_09380, partial [Gammaproteobacteria bacterium]
MKKGTFTPIHYSKMPRLGSPFRNQLITGVHTMYLQFNNNEIISNKKAELEQLLKELGITYSADLNTEIEKLKLSEKDESALAKLNVAQQLY